jgi:hypothetical protein
MKRQDQLSEAFKRLERDALKAAAQTGQDIIECSEESDLIKLLFCALRMVVKLGQREHERIQIIVADAMPPDNIEASTKLYVASPTISHEHVDFAIWAYDHTGRLRGEEGWRRAVVEIDMIPGQAPEASAATLRSNKSRRDVYVLRFTADEVFTDPWGSAVKILDWAVASFG